MLPNDMALDELSFWSAPFSLENIEDFQVCFPTNEKDEGDS